MYRQYSGGFRSHRPTNNFRRSHFSAQKINPSLFVKAASDFKKIEDLATINSFADFNFQFFC